MVLGKQKKPMRDKDEDDKISKLPDALIHHIYSFLPTQTVLSTCILSKRWKDLSNSAPILDFSYWEIDLEEEDDENKCVQKFMNFVGTVLFDHERPKIQKFLLTVDSRLDETRVNRWIRTVMKRKVEELVLSITSGKRFIFPLSFFTCDSLVVLDLEYFNILNLPNTISFPRLKILRLAHILFVDENSPRELISNCPILEHLKLFECQFKDLKVLYVTSRTLKHLTISMVGHRLHSSTLKIYAPSLLTINYAADVAADFVLDSFPSLVEADIRVYSCQDLPRSYAPLIKLYQKLSNVKLLKASGSFFGDLSAANILLADLPTFCNLVHLEFSSRLFCWHQDASSISAMRIFLWFLQLSPNLESVLISQGVYSNLEDDNWTVNLLPGYSLCNLKSVVIQDFTGSKLELDMVKFFLAKAGVLQTITISALSKDYKKQMQIASELLMFPRSSSSCVLKFLAPE